MVEIVDEPMATKVAPKKAGAKAGPRRDVFNQLFRVGEAATLLGGQGRWLRFLIENGRVPFVQKMGTQWLLTGESIRFVKRWPRTTGMKGQQTAAKMRAAAAKLDPACAVRQKAWDAKHPQGYYNKWQPDQKAGRQKPASKRAARSAKPRAKARKPAGK